MTDKKVESKKEYVIRRARQVKRYRKVAEQTIGADAYEWLVKLAGGLIKNPGIDRIEVLHPYYLALEVETGDAPVKEASRPTVSA